MESLNDWRRTKYASEISKDDFEKDVTVAGWIQDIRNLGGIAFILLRDRTAVLQVTVIKKHHGQELFKIIEDNKIDNLEKARECKELWDIKNGITYCKNCHFIYHGIRKKTVNSGKPLTDNAEGNPEPSLDSNILEGATTRSESNLDNNSSTSAVPERDDIV